MKRSKTVIAIFIVLILIVLAIVLLACTVFIVRDVTVEAEVSSHLINEERIIDSAGLGKGQSIISINKSKVKANIEKENPYVEVTNIIREFPSKIVIKATVRTGIMIVGSEDGISAAVVDSSMKVLNVISFVNRENTGVTIVDGLTFKAPEEGALSAVGTEIVFTNPSCGEILREIAVAAADPALDLSGTSFLTFFKEIDFVTGEGIKAYIRTNKGVTLVLDTSLSTTIYAQLYLCMYVFASDETEVDRTKGYILFEKKDGILAYRWVETLE